MSIFFKLSQHWNHCIPLLSCCVPANIRKRTLVLFAVCFNRPFRRVVASSRRFIPRFISPPPPRPLPSLRLRDRVVRPSSFFFVSRQLVRPQAYYQDLRSILMHPRFPACSRNRQHARARADARLDFQEARRGMPTSSTIRLRQRGSANFGMDPRGPRGPKIERIVMRREDEKRDASSAQLSRERLR